MLIRDREPLLNGIPADVTMLPNEHSRRERQGGAQSGGGSATSIPKVKRGAADRARVTSKALGPSANGSRCGSQPCLARLLRTTRPPAMPRARLTKALRLAAFAVCLFAVSAACDSYLDDLDPSTLHLSTAQIDEQLQVRPPPVPPSYGPGKWRLMMVYRSVRSCSSSMPTAALLRPRRPRS